tara:strand:- start:308 stop:1066 length:759 start_codon:yes stop_codon:yes gene_type:complete
MNNSFRIIAKLDIKDSSIIKSINFEGMRKIGEAKKFARFYFKENIDELIINDVNASLFGRGTALNFLKSSCEKIFIPVTLQGGFRSLKNISNAIRNGADKVSINTGAVQNKKLISEASKKYGNQAIVVSIDAKKISKTKWEVYVDKGREKTGINVFNWIEFVQKSGAGEIHLNSIDRDGTESGFDVNLINLVSKICKIPIIVGGGFGDLKHLDPIIKLKCIDGISMSSVIHYKRLKILEIKNYIKKKKTIRI